MNYNFKEWASRYKSIGFNISCITNTPNNFNTNSRSFFKTPSHDWVNLFRQKQETAVVESYNWMQSVGIGTFTSWRNLAVIDIDGCSDYSFLQKILLSLGLPTDYEWVVQSGSRNGFHIYYYGYKIDECDHDDVVSTFPPKQQYERYVDKIEFLWKTHVVLPPSVHASGNRYCFLNSQFPNNPPKKISNEVIYDFIFKYLDFEEIETGGAYGEVLTKIDSKQEFIGADIKQDLTKYLVDDIYCILDIETTGLPVKTGNTVTYPEILQIAWILTNDKGVVLKKNSYILESTCFSQPQASHILNVDFDVAKQVMFKKNIVFQKLVEDLKLSDYIVAHNTEFDCEILGNHLFKQYGVDLLRKKKKICIMKSSTNYCQIPGTNGYKYPKLNELYQKLFGISASNLHNAEIDVTHAFKCFKKLKQLEVI